jgi:hypothetical protein
MQGIQSDVVDRPEPCVRRRETVTARDPIQKQEGNEMRRKKNFSVNALLSGIGTVVILVLFTAGVCAALRRRIFV